MGDAKFSLGERVILAREHSRIGTVGIHESDFGKEGVISKVIGEENGDFSYHISMGPYNWGVYEEMLDHASPPPGPIEALAQDMIDDYLNQSRETTGP